MPVCSSTSPTVRSSTSGNRRCHAYRQMRVLRQVHPRSRRLSEVRRDDRPVLLVLRSAVLSPLQGGGGGGGMIVESLPMEITAEDYSEVTGARSPGLHLSEILTELNIARGGETYPDTDPQTRQNYFTMGFLWEQFLSRVFRETAIKKKAGTLIRPGEFVLNGVATSPDAIDLEDYALEEYKATYLSSAK